MGMLNKLCRIRDKVQTPTWRSSTNRKREWKCIRLMEITVGLHVRVFFSRDSTVLLPY
jgi:hypothetical protein